MRYRELVERISDPVLYHVMTAEKACHVFETNTMEARWMSRIGDRSFNGNSMSRNARFWFGGNNYGFRLTFDRFALANRHRILPVDAEVVLKATYGGGYMKPDRHRVGSENQMQEEFVVGEIKPLSAYVVECEVRFAPQAFFYNAVEMARRWCKTNQITLIEQPRVTQWMLEREAEFAEDDE